MINQDIEYVKSVLPEHYEVRESKNQGSLHCKSKTGIKHKTDLDDEEDWGYIESAIKNHFGARFIEIGLNTCFCYVDFTIYLKNN